MLRVLIVITTAMVPYGGLSSVMMNLYRQLDKDVFHIDFASTNESLDEALEKELFENGSKYYSLGKRKKNPIKYLSKLSCILRNTKYDIIHVNSNSATALMELNVAKRYGVPKRIVHNHTSRCDHEFLNKICEFFLKSSYTYAVACSQKAGEWLFGTGNFCVLNNGINTERYRFSQKFREEIRSEYGIDYSTIVIGHLGKMYQPKNHKFLIDVFFSYHEINHDSILLLVGDGDMRAEIEEKVDHLGLTSSVIFAGLQNNPEKFLSAMDCFVFPSFWEGMPLSLIEAQAAGLDCFISNTIDEGVVVTDKVKPLSIKDGVTVWVDSLCKIKKTSRDISSEICIDSIHKSGFDTYTNAKKLEFIYWK